MNARTFSRALAINLLVLLVLFLGMHFYGTLSGGLQKLLITAAVLYTLVYLGMIVAFLFKGLARPGWNGLTFISLVGGIIVMRWLLIHTYSPQYRADAVADNPKTYEYVKSDSFLVEVGFREDRRWGDVRKGDRIRIINVDDLGTGIRLGPMSMRDGFLVGTYGVTHTTLKGGPMPWGMDPGKKPDPDLWRSMAVPAMWPLLCVSGSGGNLSAWSPIVDDTTYVFAKSGKLYFGVNLMEHAYLKHTRQLTHEGSWRITAIIDRRAE